MYKYEHKWEYLNVYDVNTQVNKYHQQASEGQ